MSRLRLITFDVTNTLLRLRGSPGREYANVAKMFGVNIGHDELDRVYLDVWAEKKSEHPIYGLSEGLTTKQWWADFVRRVFCRAGYTGSPVILEVVAEKLHEKFSEGKNWETMPFASDVLKVGARGVGLMFRYSNFLTLFITFRSYNLGVKTWRLTLGTVYPS